ncbi:Endonuclease/exonuclease/phosphatase [Myxozyma melibiosi]|uniref:Endonuclease/exonuclease/phosphatase n=1 Tax=Myxozyma melibiosi TaxID=54550 RepID=A0ABR1FF25_9ASCO
MSSISTLLFTYNCGQTLQPVAPLRSAITAAIAAPTAKAAPSLIFLSLEELAPIHEVFYFEKLHKYLKPFFEAVTTLELAPYKIVSSISSGLTAGVLFIKTAAEGEDQLIASDVRTSAVSFGALSMGLKGAAAIRVTISVVDEEAPASESSKTPLPTAPVSFKSLPPPTPTKFKGVSLTFVAAHLAANEGLKAKRDQNFVDTARKLAFFPPVNPGDEYVVASVVDEQRDRDFLYKDDTHVFFCGDLNYRVQIPAAPVATPAAAKDAPKWTAPESGSFVESWLPHDELTDSLTNKTAFWGFKEAPITFDPTYKYTGSGESRAYTTKRVPSWCDRVLYLDVFEKNKVSIKKYASLPSLTTSDHSPVYALATVPIDAAPGPLPTEFVDLLAEKSIAATTTETTDDFVPEAEEAEEPQESDELVAAKNKRMKTLYAVVSDQVSAQNDHLHSRKAGRIRKAEWYFGLSLYLLFTRAGNVTLVSSIVALIAVYLYLYSLLSAFVEKNKDTSILALIFGADRVRPRRRRGQVVPTSVPTSVPT